MPIAHIDLFPNALFSLFTLSLRGTSPPNLPFTKGRNVLSFSFTTIEFSLDISFRVLMQHTSPLGKGRKRGDYLYRTDVFFDENSIDESSAGGLKGKGCVNLG